MIKLNIYQPDIPPYRVPLFNAITRSGNIKCSIVYGGSAHADPASVDFKVIHIRYTRILGFAIQSGLRAISKNSDINVVPFDLHWISPLFWGLWFRKRSKFVLWGHGFGRSRVARVVKTWVASKADSVILYSEGGKKALVSAGVDPEKIHVAVNTMFIPNSRDYSKSEKSYFLYVGRLQRRKALGFLLEAFSIYKKTQNGTYDLMFVGDGDEEKAILIDLCKKFDILENVRFENGTTDDQKLSCIYSKSVAYVSPGHVGLGVLHAFSYGVPVLTLKDMQHAPEYENIVDGYNGRLVDNSISDYSEALKYMDNRLDASILGHHAYITYTNDASPSKMLSAFMDAIG